MNSVSPVIKSCVVVIISCVGKFCGCRRINFAGSGIDFVLECVVIELRKIGLIS